MAAFHAPSLASETIAHIGSFPLRNSMLMAWLAMAVLIIGALIYRSQSKKNVVPKGFVNFVEMLIEGLYNFFHSIIQEHSKTRRFFPVIATIFLFIIVSNWMGIFPGVGTIGVYVPKEEAVEVTATSINEEISVIHAEIPREMETREPKEEKGELVHIFRTGYADVNMTLALAIISVIMTQFYGMKILGFGPYWGKFFVNPFKDFIGSFVGILELISEFAKLISFSFRLFGNIFAGEVLLVVISFLAPFIAPLPFYGLEIFVGFVQALVFSLLTAVFMKIAATSHHEEAH